VLYTGKSIPCLDAIGMFRQDIEDCSKQFSSALSV
jgi:hypothetical protein